MLLAIDPGTDSGWALFHAGELLACGLGTPPAAKVERVLIEVPVIVERGIPVSAILKLAVKAGEWGGRYGAIAEYLSPNEWKSSTPKPISHVRILARLNPNEHAVMARGTKGVALSKAHNVLDAIGIGLHGIGRNANYR